jgi:hypothetical protein
VYDLEVVANKSGPLFVVDLKIQENVELVNYNIRYFDFIENFIVGITEQGEFLKIETYSRLKTSGDTSIKKL